MSKDSKKEQNEQCTIPSVSISFDMTANQVKTLKEWKKGLPEKQFGAIDYGYTYCITPTGLGDILIVKRADGLEINLTDYDMW